MIHIREIKMPLTVRAFTVPDSNGDYNIYINMDFLLNKAITYISVHYSLMFTTS